MSRAKPSVRAPGSGERRRPNERRRVTVRRDLNDMVREANGKVSAAKVATCTGQLIAAAMLIYHIDIVLDHVEGMAVLFTFLIAPDVAKKFLNLKYQEPKQ